jgi:hypothetical protein
MHRLLLGLGWLVCVAPASAATLVHTDVAHHHSRYTIAFEVLLDADHAAVARLLGDYTRLQRLSPTVIDSRILGQVGAGEPRVQVIVRACALFLCKTVSKVADVTQLPGGDLHMRNVPELSDFTENEETWQVRPEGHATRLRYEANMVPKFFVPPLIGPLVIKSVIRRELRESAQRVEALARLP